MRFPGTDGYAELADSLVAQYESRRTNVTHPAFAKLWPNPPALVCDVGAGTGRDAAAFAARGHSVLAVEPVAEMRAHGQRLHPELTWLEDGLPDLAAVKARGERFGLIYLNAVLMHLTAEERVQSMTTLRELVAPDGVLFLTLRHGPVPAGRRMFEIPDAEVIDLARRGGLSAVHASERRDALGRDEITWSFLAFRKHP